MGHGAPGVCALGATGLLPPGVVFAICPGDGEATPVRCAGGGDAFGTGEPADELEAGELAGEPPTAAGDACVDDDVAGAGEVADGPGGAAGLAAPAAAGLSCGAGARAPIFAMSCPIRIFPRNTGRW